MLAGAAAGVGVGAGAAAVGGPEPRWRNGVTWAAAVEASRRTSARENPMDSERAARDSGGAEFEVRDGSVGCIV
jgi:hypothetical protein